MLHIPCSYSVNGWLGCRIGVDGLLKLLLERLRALVNVWRDHIGVHER